MPSYREGQPSPSLEEFTSCWADAIISAERLVGEAGLTAVLDVSPNDDEFTRSAKEVYCTASRGKKAEVVAALTVIAKAAYEDDLNREVGRPFRNALAAIAESVDREMRHRLAELDPTPKPTPTLTVVQEVNEKTSEVSTPIREPQPADTLSEAVVGRPVVQTDKTPLPADPGNSLSLVGEVWHIRYEVGEVGDFKDQAGSVFRHLARLLAEPGRRFGALDFYPPPPGAAPIPCHGRDESSDERAREDYKKRLESLIEEIKEAEHAHDAETADVLRNEFNQLTVHCERESGARKRGHKKQCGTPSALKKADQNLRVGFHKLPDRVTKRGLPKLAEHLRKHIVNSEGEWWYAPPPGTTPWHVSHPESPAQQ